MKKPAKNFQKSTIAGQNVKKNRLKNKNNFKKKKMSQKSKNKSKKNV